MTNHLANETSPYLLQHAHNPVDWYPWGEQAFALARAQNKPILLSIGYSACHWCHVMAQESFEDAEVAAVMNAHFINIKVDREERPDIDQIYQTAHYMLIHRGGGWPLTMFLTPEQKPFFGGTYFPKLPRHGLPGFLDLLPRIAEVYYTQGEAIAQQNAALIEALTDTLPAKNKAGTINFSETVLEQALNQLESSFDSVYGGFGNAPKFFHPAELTFCLQRYFKTKQSEFLHIGTHTLEKMAKGGIYDQLGGGFFRYSTDQYWRIPHFEKMLYDNGPLLRLYSDAWLATANSYFKQVTEETAEWVMREMQAPESREGGYYSTLDAESEHEEGKFYIWKREQVAQILPAEEFKVAAAYYGLTQEPNFEQKHWNLEITQSIEETARAIGISQKQVQDKLAAARKTLFSARESRVHPGRDEKILVSWNGLMIKGMAHAGRVLEREEWIHSAMLAADFIRTTMWKDNRLMATYKDGKAHLNAYLDDYVFLLDGLLELMQAEFRPIDLHFATALADILLEQFEDKAAGGFFFTSHDHEQLIHRPKTAYDNATPSGNGVAAIVLQRLGYLLGEYRYLQAAEKTLRLFYPAMSQDAMGHCSLLIALEEAIVPPRIVILRGYKPALCQWQTVLQHQAPHILVLALPSDLADLPPALNKTVSADKISGEMSAWVCEGASCLPEISNLQELLHVCEVQGRIAPSL